MSFADTFARPDYRAADSRVRILLRPRKYACHPGTAAVALKAGVFPRDRSHVIMEDAIPRGTV